MAIPVDRLYLPLRSLISPPSLRAPSAMLQERLLDVDERVRTAAVRAFCAVFTRAPKLLPTADLRATAERLRDKKVRGVAYSIQ